MLVTEPGYGGAESTFLRLARAIPLAGAGIFWKGAASDA